MINRYRRAARQVHELKLSELDPFDAALAVKKPAVAVPPTSEQLPTAQREVGQDMRRTAGRRRTTLRNYLARPKGLEPLTGGLETRCSIRLSYERVLRNYDI
jgi:hypothetical protein